MMTNYNDGQWHNWSGGKCPVHPQSLIDQVWHDDEVRKVGLTEARTAGSAAWGQTLKFRVVQEYREPREFYIVGGCEAYDSMQEAQDACSKLMHPSIVHVREVTE